MTMGSLAELYSWFPVWVLRGFVLFFGLIWGSFLNVVIYRVPRDMSVVSPPSHCPGCGKPIKGYDNVPVFGWLILRGRARCCGVKMSPRYPLVELIGGLISLAIFEGIIRQMPDQAPAARALCVYGADFAMCMGLLAAAFIDAEHMFLPDSITIGGTILGVATATTRGLPFMTSVYGALIGFAIIWLPFIFLYKGLLGRTGMGMGDAKLMALAGAWFGWPGAIFVLFAGALQGTVYAGVTKILGIESKLPEAVQQDIDQLKADAAAGDEEAKKALLEDPLTEDENDAFILRWLGFAQKAPEPVTEGAPTSTKDGANDEAGDEDIEVPRARLPFGPFLILGCFELLFFFPYFEERLEAFFAPFG